MSNIDWNKFTTDMWPYFLRLADFEAKNGDFVIADSLEQEIHHLMQNYSNFYESPTLGIGIMRMLKRPIDKLILRGILSKGLSEDGIKTSVMELITLSDLNDEGLRNTALKQFVEKYGIVINIEASR